MNYELHRKQFTHFPKEEQISCERVCFACSEHFENCSEKRDETLMINASFNILLNTRIWR
jgi:hypothetical protein